MIAPDRERVLGALDVSRETAERLDRFVALLAKWTPTINLVSRSTLASVWTRHILDSAQLLALAPAGARTWADLGSGGGFPGIVIAILAAEKQPALRVTLVESDLRKSAFLMAAIQDLGLDTRVCAERSESLAPLDADVVSARAFAPLTDLLAHAQRHLSRHGRALFPKGATHEAEIAEALERWRFSVQKTPSQTDAQAVILSIGDIARA